jgi:hypothetical protein
LAGGAAEISPWGGAPATAGEGYLFLSKIQ